MRLVTTVEGVSKKPDHYQVDIGIDADQAMMPRQVQLMRARARAMIAVGLVNVAGEMPFDIDKAIMNLDFGEVQRATEIVDEDRYMVTVRVNR